MAISVIYWRVGGMVDNCLEIVAVCRCDSETLQEKNSVM